MEVVIAGQTTRNDQTSVRTNPEIFLCLADFTFPLLVFLTNKLKVLPISFGVDNKEGTGLTLIQDFTPG